MSAPIAKAPCQGVLWERKHRRMTLWGFRNSREKDTAVWGSGEGKPEYVHGSDPQPSMAPFRRQCTAWQSGSRYDRRTAGRL